jgi:predicted PurR-regulated permease PerM
VNTDPLGPLVGGTNRIEVVASSGIGHEIVLILLALNFVILSSFLVYALLRSGRMGEMPTLSGLNWRRFVSVSLLTLVFLYFLWAIRSILPPFLIAFFLAGLLDPVVTSMQKRSGRSRGYAVGSLFSLAFLVVVLAGILLVRAALPQMQDLVKNGQSYANEIIKRQDILYNEHQKQFAMVGITQNPFSDQSGPVLTGVTHALNGLKSSVMSLAGDALWLIIIPLSLTFFLLEYQLIRAKLISFVPLRYRANVDRMSQEVVDIFSQYLRGLAKVCVIYGLAMSAIFLLFGLNYAIFLGLAAGVLYAVPYVGPVIAMGSAGIIALTMGRTPVQAAFVVAAFLATHVTFDYVITPRVVGGSVGLHPLVNVFALMVGATLFGVPGMLLAVPVAASIQKILVYFFPRLVEMPALPATAITAPTPDERVLAETVSTVD